MQEEESDDVDLSVEGDDETNPSGGDDATSSTEINDLDADEVSEDSAPKSLVDKLKAKFAPKKKSSQSDEGTEVGVGGKAGKKKKINPVILIIVVVALAALFLLPEEEEAPVATAPSSFKKPDRKIKKKVEKTDEEKKDEEKKDEEKKDEEKKDEEKKDETPVSETEEPKESAPVETPTEDIATDVTETESTTVETPVEAPKEEEGVKVETSPDTEDGQVPQPAEEGNITEKILEDLEKQVQKDKPKEIKKEYVAPPDYEYKGRGLVYNCAGKHWACVDAPSYKLCEDNFSSVTYLNKKVECHPSNIYESTKGCELMQNRYVSSSQKTDFCK